MKARASVLGLVLGLAWLPGLAQAVRQVPVSRDAAGESLDEPMPVDAASVRAAQTFAAKARVAAAPAKPTALVPLSARERVQQVLDRFTFGPRPGEVDRVLAMGEDKWLSQQLNPASIADGVSDRRLADFPTLNMTPEQVLGILPNRNTVYAVSDGKTPFPADPMGNAVMEVMVARWRQQQDVKKADGTVQTRVEPTEAEKAAQKKVNQAAASRLAGELFALPKAQRMAAVIAMPVDDRIVLADTGNLTGDQRSQLVNDFTPREREAFGAMSGGFDATGVILNELAQARLVRDVLTERQLQEVMTDFWFNHFNVFGPKDSDTFYTTSYERDAIRKHALGSFKDLLLATAESPAMMVYLDNYLSIGPDSLANGVNPANPNAKRGNKGLNENYGREVMELHTVGVNGGYTQADVTALAAILTGWGVDRANQGGPFVFDPKRHEPGPKYWLGYELADDGSILAKGMRPAAGAATFGPSSTVATPASMGQGVAALTILAASPQTAHFISYLLAQRFVADAPPPALVDALTRVYLASNGDIRTLLRALIASPEFNSRQYFRNKVKTPVEFVASAFRSSATDPQNPGALVGVVRKMGMPLYNALPPTGYYITADQWMNSAALVDRLNFAYQLTNGKFANQKFDAPRLLAMGLMTSTTAAPGSPSPSGTEGKGRVLAVASAGDAPTDARGTDLALHVLEATVIGGPVSPQTNVLIHKQIDQQPANATATDTLNLLTALVLGSPDFQLR